MLQCGKGDKHWQLFALEPYKPTKQAPDVSLRKALLLRHRFQTRHIQVPPLPRGSRLCVSACEGELFGAMLCVLVHIVVSMLHSGEGHCKHQAIRPVTS